VRTVFTDQINATEGIEYMRFAQWKFDPTLAPATGPDLSESRTAIDGFNKTMVDEIALQWNSLHSPTCSADLQETTDAVATARQLDPLYRQALASATRSYCRIT
jgi:chorismate mutase